jgi:hypothetical protein
MAKSLDDYRREVRQAALLNARENMPQYIEWLVTEVAYHRWKDDLDREWDDQRYREAILASKLSSSDAEEKQARRESPTIKEENAHV